MEVQVLIENVVFTKNLVAEHGLSLLLKKGDKEIVVDTGQSGNFIKNCNLMGIDIDRIKKVVLTHGHYDHIGGLESLIKRRPDVKIYAHKNILDKKYALRKSGKLEEIGFDSSFYQMHRDNFVLIERDTEIEEGFHVITNTEVKYNNEFTTKNFFTEKDGQKVPDKFLDEVFVVVEEDDSINVVTGCSHAGILNIIETAKNRFKGKNIKSLIGGFHLRGMKEEEIRDIAEKIEEYGVKRVLTGHCTGIDEYSILKSVLKDSISYLSTSSSFVV
ncbi:MBL fold metallo-hydrolase [Caldanaerobacter sp.]|uniref:MBL fold metallo-hydrolase n=1 Tax=Caldanaerobacter sp. TaxID=2930036 RepID=UPI003C739CEC